MFNILKKVIVTVLSSTLALYLIGFVVIRLAVDEKKVDVKILNYLRDSARYVRSFSSGDNKFNELKFQEAVEYYEKILKVMPFQQLTHGALGYCYYYAGENKKAINSFKLAIEESPVFLGYYYDLGLVYFNSEDWEQAIEVFKQVISLDMDATTGYFSVVSEKMFKDAKKRELWLRGRFGALANIPTDSFKMLVLSYDALGMQKDVFNVAFNSIKLRKESNDGFFNFFAGKSAYELGQYERAFNHFNVCIKLNSKFKQAYYYKSLILKEMGNESASKIFLEESKSLDEFKVFEKKELIYFTPLYEIGG